MALNHETNPQRETGDGNPLLRLDALLATLADRAASRWQARTPFSRQGLTLGLYIVAALLGVGYALITGELLFLGIGFLAYMGSLPGRQRGSLVEEIQLEATGLPRHTTKYLAIGVLTIGLFGIVSSLPSLALAPLVGAFLLGEIAGVVGGGSLVVLKVADYIARTNPPDRGDRERQIERVGRRATMGAAI